MRQKTSLILTLVAWLLATGSHWDLVQTYAWGRMVTDFAQQMSFSDAVAKTFSPETMCQICHVVADAKQEQSKSSAVPGGKADGKILLVCAPAAIACHSRVPRFVGQLQSPAAPPSAERAAPPVPPPRVSVA